MATDENLTGSDKVQSYITYYMQEPVGECMISSVSRVPENGTLGLMSGCWKRRDGLE